MGIVGADYHFSDSIEEGKRIARRNAYRDGLLSIGLSTEEIAKNYDNRTPEEHAYGMLEARRIIEGKQNDEPCTG